MKHDARQALEYALQFTALYKSEPDIALREAKCLKLQVPYILEDMRADDLVIGFAVHELVGFSPQYGGSYTYYYHDDRVAKAIDSLSLQTDAAFLNEIAQMRGYWHAEATYAKYLDRVKQKLGHPIPRGMMYSGCGRLAGVTVDLKMLIKLGLDGLYDRVMRYERINGPSSFYTALLSSIEVISEACLAYQAQAMEWMNRETDEKRKAELLAIACILGNIAHKAPETFKEGLQLVWIYAVCSDLMNYGRMDNYLGELYQNDIDSGALTEEEALKWLSSLFRNIIRVGKIHDGRIMLGGEGRDNPRAADALALMLIKTAREVKDVLPQLTLRYFKDMDKRLMQETLCNIQSGCVYPIVYSDDTVVPSVEKSYGIEREMARRWVPFGCGEYVLEGFSVGTPNTTVTLAIVLDALLHRGVDSFAKRQVIQDMGDPASFDTFESLFSAYEQAIAPLCLEEAFSEEINYDVAGENACFLHSSLLMHDCVEKGKPLLQGGVRYLCATSEIFGLITCADSLMAIKKLVYDQKRFTLGELVHMLDRNFEGYERERHMLLDAPKYGNDNDEADAMAMRVFNHISDAHTAAGQLTRLYRYHIVSVNNSGSADRGDCTAATPCGRKKGEPLSNGNSPSIGAEKSGLTASLLSMAKIDPAKHVGVVHNVRFNKNLLTENMDAIEALLETFYENNGVQTNLSAIGKDDLQQALLYPERYRNLIVRIGGFSARFVELDPVTQHEILLRTTHEAW